MRLATKDTHINKICDDIVESLLGLEGTARVGGRDVGDQERHRNEGGGEGEEQEELEHGGDPGCLRTNTNH
jgi:hypothetical protein